MNIATVQYEGPVVTVTKGSPSPAGFDREFRELMDLAMTSAVTVVVEDDDPDAPVFRVVDYPDMPTDQAQVLAWIERTVARAPACFKSPLFICTESDEQLGEWIRRSLDHGYSVRYHGWDGNQ